MGIDSGNGDELDAGGREAADRGTLTPPRSRSVTNRFLAYLVMLGWYGLVIIAYFVILGRQSGLRDDSYGNSPWEDMLIVGVNCLAPVLVGTLLAGLILLGRLLAKSRIRSAIVLGTAAASPMLLSVAAVAGFVLR